MPYLAAVQKRVKTEGERIEGLSLNTKPEYEESAVKNEVFFTH